MRQWKNFENRLIFGEDDGQWESWTFFETQCINRNVQNVQLIRFYITDWKLLQICNCLSDRTYCAGLGEQTSLYVHAVFQ